MDDNLAKIKAADRHLGITSWQRSHKGAAGQPMALAVCTKIKGSTRVENYELILLVPFLATDSAVIVWEWARVVQDKL